MKRRPLRAVGSFGFSALCICLSTIALQALTTSPSPTPSSFLWPSSSPSAAKEFSSVDLRLRNLSVHRVRYVDEEKEAKQPTMQTLADFLTTTNRPRSAEVSSVVVTWEDHPLAARARAKDARLEDEEEEEREEEEDSTDSEGDSLSYEVQIWVTGWGLDGMWNPANKRVITRDPFLVLMDLPLELEMGFRARVKAKQVEKSLLGFLLPKTFLSTETDGPWSDVVILSPTRDDEFEAIVTSLAGNKPLLLLLAVCIGSGCLVVAQLYFRRRLEMTRQRNMLKMQSSRHSSSEQEAEVEDEDEDGSDEDSGRSVQELKHEIRDLRQELADSEDEVRQLMLFSGYGIETLAPHELEQLERELRHTLNRIHRLKKHSATPEPEEMDIGTKKQPPAEEQSRRERRRRPNHKKREALPMSPIFEHRSF